MATMGAQFSDKPTSSTCRKLVSMCHMVDIQFIMVFHPKNMRMMASNIMGRDSQAPFPSPGPLRVTSTTCGAEG